MTTAPDPALLRVLLVDDDPDQRLLVTRLLARRSVLDVTEAQDAEQALGLVPTVRPHLILLDLAMPGRSGLEALPDLHAAAPDAAIVVLSNLPRRRLLGQVLSRGAVGFVEKGVAPNRLVDEIFIAASLADSGRAHVLDLAASASSARSARQFTRELLADADRQLVSDIEVLVSELITNAVVHTGSEPRLEVHVMRHRLRIEVYDDDPTSPRPRDPDVDRPGGRGLHLVERIATRWGSEPVGSGKVVWFEIDQS